MTTTSRIWLILAILTVGDIVWCRALGIRVADWQPFVAITVAVFCIIVVLRRNEIGERTVAMAEWTLLWIVFSVAGALLTYAAAAQGGPLYDAQFAALDAALGFDWSRWHDVVAAHPALWLPFAAAYTSLFPQALFTVCRFSGRDAEARNAELLVNASVALLVTTALFCLFPTLGPCADQPACQDAYIDDLVGLRSGKLPSLDIIVLKGVIAFPSFHAVLAVLFTYAHRRSASFIPVAAFNGLMLLSVPSEGGHYLVDVFGGIAVGGMTILALRVLPARVPALAPAEPAAPARSS